MNPIYQAIMSALHLNQRVCPKCGKKQTIADRRRRETVTCKFCGWSIPPSRAVRPRR